MSRREGTTEDSAGEIKSHSTWRVWIGVTLSLIIVAGCLMAVGVTSVLDETQTGTKAALAGSLDAKNAAEQAKNAAELAKKASDESAALSAFARQLVDPNNPVNKESVRQRQELLSSINYAVSTLTEMVKENSEFEAEVTDLLNQIIFLLNSL